MKAGHKKLWEQRLTFLIAHRKKILPNSCFSCFLPSGNLSSLVDFPIAWPSIKVHIETGKEPGEWWMVNLVPSANELRPIWSGKQASLSRSLSLSLSLSQPLQSTQIGFCRKREKSEKERENTRFASAWMYAPAFVHLCMRTYTCMHVCFKEGEGCAYRSKRVRWSLLKSLRPAHLQHTDIYGYCARKLPSQQDWQYRVLWMRDGEKKTASRG